MPSEKTPNWTLSQPYSQLPKVLFSAQLPTKVESPKLLLFNTYLANFLEIDTDQLNESDIAAIFVGNTITAKSSPIAQAYAGHQFGHFTKLGDGRAILMGEISAPDNNTYDIQLKGPGATPYSRNGDGRATLRAMLREYLISEAMHGLGIASSRSLAVVETGQKVYREQVHAGAVLTRIMRSHVRVGTFEFARNFADTVTLKALADYVIEKYYPKSLNSENKYLHFFESVQSAQIDLIVDWMRVGFIHGVMNTDNTSITAETFDYGPCAFMNGYNLETTFSSIDHNSRYSYGNQPGILRWNLSMLANALLPLFHENMEESVKLAEAIIHKFQDEYFQKWYAMMYRKLGLVDATESDNELVKQLLAWFDATNWDYTNTFLALQLGSKVPNNPIEEDHFQSFYQAWQKRIHAQPGGYEAALELMKSHNPSVIARNHKVEEALSQAELGDYTIFNELLGYLQKPYSNFGANESFLIAPDNHDANFQTFCGT
jgi:serine/tyrosine/threonine adenylyltransferase